MYEKLAGINPVKPGYKEILIKPRFIKGITSVDSSFDSVYGVIRFTMDTTLGAMVLEPLAVEMFNQYMPGMLDGPMIKFAYGMTVSELTATMPPEGAELFKKVLDALNRQ